MHRHLLTRRGLPALVASLSALGIAGVTTASAATAPTTVSVDTNTGSLFVQDMGSNQNIILVTRRADVTSALDGTHQVIRVQDSAGVAPPPSDYPFSPPAAVGGLVSLVAGNGCRPVTDGTPNAVDCTSNGPSFPEIDASLGGGEDYFSPTAAQPGGALPKAFVYGDDGNDYLKGTEAGDTLNGGAGDDELFGNGGDDTLKPGSGDDGRISGGAGTDTVDYRDVTTDLHVSLDDRTNDGPNGKANVESDVENVDGGSGNDVIVGDGAANLLRGQAGNDVIDGGLGNDVVDGGEGDNVLTGGPETLAAGQADDDSILVAGGDNTIYGGAGDDHVTLGNANLGGTNIVFGGDGNDVVSGGVGADTIYGQGGDDTLAGGGGPDLLQGGAGTDALDGGSGIDTVSYTDKTDPVYAAGGAPSGTFCGDRAEAGKPCEGDSIANAENLAGGAGGDHLVGDGGANVLTGGGGSDVLDGLGGDDALWGGAGDDVLNGGDGADEMHGGAGTDSVSYQDAGYGVNVSLDGVRNDGQQCPGSSCENDNLSGDIENVTGSTHADVLTGSDAANVLTGLAGDDTLDGRGGADRMDGGDGNDTVTYADRTGDVAVSLDGLANDGAVAPAEGDDVTATVENVVGGAGNDRLTGDAAANRLAGGAGNDVLDGGLGADELTGGTGTDTVVYDRPAGTSVVVTLNNDNDDGAPGEGDNVHSDVENLTGGAEDDNFVGDADGNVLTGNGGADELDGAQGDDILRGGAGADVLHGGAGADLLDPGANDGAPDQLFGEGGSDVADYHAYSGAVTVTADDVADDGAAGEADNVHSDVELPWLPGQADPSGTSTGGGDSGGGGGGGGSTPSAASQTQASHQATPRPAGSFSTSAAPAPIAPATQPGAPRSSLRTTVRAVRTGKLTRAVLVSGRVVAAGGCRAGGRVAIAVRSASRGLAGKRVVTVSRTCAFRTIVRLARPVSKGRFSVEVRFLGNRALAPSRRVTRLQVGG